MGQTPRDFLWLSAAGGAVVVQELATTYPVPGAGPRLFWGALSFFLLYRIWRGGRLAWKVFLAVASVGVLLYGLQAATGGRVLVLAGAYVVQVVAMLMLRQRRVARTGQGSGSETLVASG